MPAAALPVNETQRLRRLQELDVLDTPPERQLDDIALIAAGMFGAPIALVSLIDGERQWFKARVGLDVCETPRDAAFCAHAILSNDVLVISDALEDVRFADSPLVLGPPYIRFYAGAPLRATSGHNLGTLCVIDQKPRPNFGEAEAERLRGLANLVETHFALRSASQRMSAEIESRQDMLIAYEHQHMEYEMRLKNKRDFLAKAAHEIRAPLNSVQACAAMLRTEIHGAHSHPHYKDYAAIIEDASRYVENLCAGLLDYARARSGDFRLAVSRIDLIDLTEEAIDIICPSAALGSITIEWEHDERPLAVMADPARLKQALLNVLSNAMKFTPSGGSIKISAARMTDGRRRVWITDTGVGISPSEIDRAFTPFGQTATKTQNGMRGTGLGIPISRLILERHGGSLTLDSILGTGTTVTFLLPDCA